MNNKMKALKMTTAPTKAKSKAKQSAAAKALNDKIAATLEAATAPLATATTIDTTSYVVSGVASLKLINTQNKSVNEAIKLAIVRLNTTNVSKRATQLIVSFLQTAANQNFDFSAGLVKSNVYAIEKATKILKALKSKSSIAIDKYTLACSFNALKRTKNKNINNAEMNASLCAALQCESLSATMQRLHKASSTATTQASSSRVALAALDIVTNDVQAKSMSFNDNKIAKAFLNLLKK